jgi:GTP-binding protein HflX
LLTDTVGFINNLPTQLIAAFRATLEEISEATMLIHVVDVTHPNAIEQVITVKETLEDLGVDDRPVLFAMNKIDRLSKEERARLPEAAPRMGIPDNAVSISAQKGINIDGLMDAIETVLEQEEGFTRVTAHIPFSRSELVERFHTQGRVDKRDFDENGTILTGWLPERELSRFGEYVSVGRVAPNGQPSSGEAEKAADIAADSVH